VDRLGILVEPSQVRLKPNPDDGYLWEKLDNKEHLFSKNISDHSTGALKELYRDVGLSFEAVANDKSHGLPNGSFTATVRNANIFLIIFQTDFQVFKLFQWGR
jgi:hypothetical protein